MSDLAALVGQVHLHPGRALPSIASGRPQIADRVAVGVRADDLAQRLGALFTLCAMPHRMAARLAVAAARGEPDAALAADVQALRATQAREQILRIVHDWPRWLPSQAAPAALATALRSCPLWRTDLGLADQMDALPVWLEHLWLGIAPDRWLAAHDADPLGWAARWCEGGRGAVAATLRSHRSATQRLVTRSAPWQVLDDTARNMPALARRMAGDAGFCAQPDWCGEVPDTGPWSRAHDRVRTPVGNAWARLVSRVVDVLRLASPCGERWLAHGALPLTRGEGIAWVEMARGLLVHWVRLEPGCDGQRVAACRVLAPTEWNFHPRGLLAQALSALGGGTAEEDARRLAVAFDPCVEFVVHRRLEPEAEAVECTK